MEGFNFTFNFGRIHMYVYTYMSMWATLDNLPNRFGNVVTYKKIDWRKSGNMVCLRKFGRVRE